MIRFLLVVLILSNYLFSDSIKVNLHWKHQFEFAGFYAAIEKGYYKDVGLDVELFQKDISQSLGEKCLKGEVQFFTSYNSVIRDIQNGKQYQLVANYLKRSPLALAVKKDILVPKDLKNKTIMATKEEMQSANFRKMFLENGIKKDDYKLVANSLDLEEFRLGRADAISIYLTNEPYFLRKHKTPFVIMDPSHYGGDLLYDENLLTSKEYAKKHPDIVRKFVNATNKGWQYALQNKEEIVNLILEKYNTQKKSKEHLLFEADEIEKLMEPDAYAIGSIDFNRIKKIEELYIKLGDAKKYIEPEEFVWEPKDFYKKVLLTQKEKEFIKKHPSITFGIDSKWPPYIIIDKNGRQSGYEIEMLKKINELTGLNIHLKTGQWSDMLEEAKSHKIAGVTTSVYHKEREKDFIFSNPYNLVRYMIVTAPGNPYNFKQPKELKGMDIAVEKGNLVIIKIARNLSGKDLTFSNSRPEAFDMVARDEVQATIASEDIWYWISKNDYRNVLPAFTLPDKIELRYSIRKDWLELKSILDKAIKAIPEEEKIALKNKWLLIKDSNMNRSVNLTSKEKEFLDNHPIIKVSSEYDWPPLDYHDEDDRPAGYSIDYLTLIAKKLGIKIEFVSDKWSTLVEKFNTRQIDIIHSLASTPEREKLGWYIPFLKLPVHFVIRDGASEPQTIKDMYGKTAVYFKGWQTSQALKKKHPQLKFYEVDTTLEGYHALALGKADFLIDQRPAAYYMIQKNRLYNLKIAGIYHEESETGLHIAVRKDWPELNSIIKKTMDSISLEEIHRVNKKWHIGNDKPEFLSLKEQEWLKKYGALKLCIDPNWEPLEYIDENGIHAGISSEFMKILTQKIGQKAVLYPTKNWQEALDAAQEGRCDILPMIAKTPSREKYLNFTTPHFSSKNVIVTREDVSYIEDISKLENEIFGVVKDYAITELIKQKYPKIKLLEVDSVEDGLQQVDEKKIFGFIDTVPTVAWHIKNMGLIQLKISGDTGIPLKLGFGVKKDYPELYSIVQKAVDTITQNEKDAIVNHYVNVRYEKGFDYTFFYKISGIILFVFLFIFYHIIQKEKLNKALREKVREELEKSRQKDNMIFHQNKLISMGEMIENIAHQWRQPLSQINASVLVIDDKIAEKRIDSKGIEKELNDIENMTKYMSHTIDDFRNLLSQEKNIEIFTLNDILEKTFMIIESSLKYHNIAIEENVRDNFKISGYKSELMQVLLVILNNAKDILIENKVKLPKIMISIYSKNELMNIKISDNGGGVVQENLQKIFEPYFTTKYKTQGTGLGLYISKVIIEQGMNGKLEVENNKTGACFTISLNRAEDE
ncbi:MAG: transporter substrate-binding domain-containing protein [Arcobacter sp.]|uniref:transporter substrate-binding domain-containing protein n=1 Tax=Arcobacter sp. TaxID=1872629 RepID=UPI003AFFE24A